VHEIAIFMHMRTTLILDDALLAKAQKLTKISEKTAVIHYALREVVARESARRLAALGGSEPQLRAIPRRRPGGKGK
jgi:Arc/MetJ family transcription regulator